MCRCWLWSVLAASMLLPQCLSAQSSDIKFIADTLVIQADGTYEADPDLATLTFDISAQDKDLRQTYEHASQSLQKVLALADKNGIAKTDVNSGVLTVQPYYDNDKRKRAKYYLVQAQVTMKVKDFSKLGPIIEGAVDDGITDFRSLTYLLADEEAAKRQAVSEAMRRAVGRAQAALEPKGQKVGSLRFANLDVKQMVGVSRMDVYQMAEYSTVTVAAETTTVGKHEKQPAAPPPPLPRPQKITVSATVQCAFQIL